MRRQVNARSAVIRSVVFDTEPLWCRTFVSMLERRSAGPIAVCRSLGELVGTLADEPPPRLLVADPGEGPAFCDALRYARESVRDLTTVVVSATRDEAWRQPLRALGVASFIAKEHEVEVIEEQLRNEIETHIRLARLTPREVEILELAARGHSNAQIAALLWLSDQTVKFHLGNIYRRLDVGDRAGAIAEARREGLLPVDDASVAASDAEDGMGATAT